MCYRNLLAIVKHISLMILAAIIFVMPLWFLSTYIHEQGHINEAKKQNISFVLREINFSPVLFDFGKGFAIPASNKDCVRFNLLPIETRRKITRAGVKNSLFILIPLEVFLIYFCFLDYTRGRTLRNFKFSLLLLLNCIILFMMFWIVYQNVFIPNPLNDWHLVSLDCSRYV